ncbi:MAG TPA: TetR/AcrR family transcriptional regulator [Pseudonocardiaceae bacterium]|nr:TetR/AcrR family transcriptional regulator [Pseudonocardiaceae bacterium]
MTSKRNSATPAHRVSDDVLLDAARECVLSVGVRRTTLTDIAKRAGTSRMTVYRRFPGVTSVVAALMTREFGTLLGEAGDTSGGTARQRLVGASVLAARRLVADPLLRSVLDRDAELLLPYLVQRVGGTQRLAEKFITEQLTAGHADGSIRQAPVAAQTRVLFLTVQAFVISHRPAAQDVADDDLLAELAASLDHGLRPA